MWNLEQPSVWARSMSAWSVFLRAFDSMSVMGNHTANTMAATEPAWLEPNSFTNTGSHTRPGTGPMIFRSGDSQ